MKAQITTKRTLIITFKLLLLVTFVTAIYSCWFSSETPIQKILNNPREYSSQNVTVSGHVIEVYSFIVVKYFILKDKTGEITVITEQPMPKKGAKLSVTGMVREAFSIGDKQLIVLVEKNNDNK